MVAVATGTFRLRVDTKGERREDPRDFIGAGVISTFYAGIPKISRIGKPSLGRAQGGRRRRG
jgi:hypothetical protein